MKLCKDCRHSFAQPIVGRKDVLQMCRHPDASALITDYYNGGTRISHPTCQQARMIGKCETEGKLWEAQEIGFGAFDEE